MWPPPLVSPTEARWFASPQFSLKKVSQIKLTGFIISNIWNTCPFDRYKIVDNKYWMTFSVWILWVYGPPWDWVVFTLFGWAFGESQISCRDAHNCNNNCFSSPTLTKRSCAQYIWCVRWWSTCINPENWFCYVWACRSLCMPTQRDSSKVESCLRGQWEYLHIAISIKT